MSATDSSILINSLSEIKLGFHVALAYSEEQGVIAAPLAARIIDWADKAELAA